MGNYKAAVAEHILEYKNNPRNIDNLVAYGKSLVEVGQAQEALKYLNEAMALAPKSSAPKYEAGWANFKLGKLDGAVSLYLMALRYDQANPLIYKRLGIAYEKMGNVQKAGEAFRKYLEMEPDASDRAKYQRYL